MSAPVLTTAPVLPEGWSMVRGTSLVLPAEGVRVRTRAFGTYGTVMTYEMTFSQGEFPVWLDTGVVRQLTFDEIEVVE